jgi:hypothetical protein
MINSPVKQDALRIAALPIGSSQRAVLYAAASHRWSEKALCGAFERLIDAGLVEYGVSARTGWLTSLGQAALAELTP